MSRKNKLKFVGMGHRLNIILGHRKQKKQKQMKTNPWEVQIPSFLSSGA
jgi:hypothetical protein